MTLAKMKTTRKVNARRRGFEGMKPAEWFPAVNQKKAAAATWTTTAIPLAWDYSLKGCSAAEPFSASSHRGRIWLLRGK
jgi:hypothetical protein